MPDMSPEVNEIAAALAKGRLAFRLSRKSPKRRYALREAIMNTTMRVWVR